MSNSGLLTKKLITPLLWSFVFAFFVWVVTYLMVINQVESVGVHIDSKDRVKLFFVFLTSFLFFFLAALWGVFGKNGIARMNIVNDRVVNIGFSYVSAMIIFGISYGIFKVFW